MLVLKQPLMHLKDKKMLKHPLMLVLKQPLKLVLKP